MELFVRRRMITIKHDYKSMRKAPNKDPNILDDYMKDIKREGLYSNEEVNKLTGEYAKEKNNRTKKGLENKIIKSQLRYVVKIAKHFASKNPHLMMDLINEGNIGVMHGLEKYDKKKGYAFTTYVTWWINHFIIRSLLTKYDAINIPLKKSELVSKYEKIDEKLNEKKELKPGKERNFILNRKDEFNPEERKTLIKLINIKRISHLEDKINENMCVEDVIASPYHFLDDMFKKFLRHELLDYIGKLEDERWIIAVKESFAFNKECKKASLMSIGKMIGISKEGARQMIIKSLKKIHKLAKNNGLKAYLND